MRITKDLAQSLAIILLKNNRMELEKAKNEAAKYVDKLVKESLPYEISMLPNKLKDWVKTRSRFTFTDGVRESYNKRGTCDLASKGETVKIGPSQMDTLEKKSNKIEKMQHEYNDAKSQIKAALYALRTKKRVLEQFPILAPEFPEEGERGLTNFNELKSLIK